MKTRILIIALLLALLVGCGKKSSTPLSELPPAETAENISGNEAVIKADEVKSETDATPVEQPVVQEIDMHTVAPEPVRTGNEKQESEFVEPDGENIRFTSRHGYQLVDGGAYLGGAWLSYYDLENSAKSVVCAVEACTHSDEFCGAWIGVENDFAIYRDELYVLQKTVLDNNWMLRIQKRRIEDTEWKTVWESKTIPGTNLLVRGMVGGNWAVLTLDARSADAGMNGATTISMIAINLEDGAEKEIIPVSYTGVNAPAAEGDTRLLSASLWGVAEGCCVISTSVLPAEFPNMDDYIAASGKDPSAALDDYFAKIDAETITEYACYDLSGEEKVVISSGRAAEVIGVCDTTALYKGDFYFFKDGKLRSFSLLDKSEREILDASYIGRITVVDGQVFYLLEVGGICELDSFDLESGLVTKFNNEGNEAVVVFTVYQENKDMFAGNYNGIECWISKADYYAENFSAAVSIP